MPPIALTIRVSSLPMSAESAPPKAQPSGKRPIPMVYRDITRPRMSPIASRWKRLMMAFTQNIPAIPMMKRSARVRGYMRENPKPIMQKSQTKLATMMIQMTRRGKPAIAMIKLPTASPMPNAADITPKPTAPTSRILVAYSGMRGKMATPKTFTDAFMMNSHGRTGDLRANAMPCLTLS